MHPHAELLLDRSKRRTHPLGDGVASNRKPAVTLRLVAHVRKAEKVKRFRAYHATLGSAFARETTELDQACLGGMKLQAELSKTVSERFQARLGLVLMLKPDHKSSSPGELHPQALTEPDVNLSTHPALIVQSQGESRFARARTIAVLGGRQRLTSELHVGHGERTV